MNGQNKFFFIPFLLAIAASMIIKSFPVLISLAIIVLFLIILMYAINKNLTHSLLIFIGFDYGFLVGILIRMLI